MSSGQTGTWSAGACLAGEGHLATLMRSVEWSKTPLGAVSEWTQTLQTAVNFALGAHLPIAVHWSRAYFTLYNDAFGEILADKHPWAIGRRAEEIWVEHWALMRPILDAVMSTGLSAQADDVPWVLGQQGAQDERRFSLGFSPLRAAGGDVEGILVSATEINSRSFFQAHAASDRLHSTPPRRVHKHQTLPEHALNIQPGLSASHLQAELMAERLAVAQLDELTSRLFTNSGIQSLLDEVLAATIALQRADFGLVQLYNPTTQVLEVVSQRGFEQDFLDHTRDCRDETSCGLSPVRLERVIVEDVQKDPGFAVHAAAAAGFRAVHSTPILTRNGEALGVISTHFSEPHRPHDREMRFTDIYARMAAELIERRRTEEALRISEERFRRYFDLGLIGMAITSVEKGCLEVNDELCRILGYERRELLGMLWTDVTHPDDVGADLAQFQRVLVGEIDGYTLDKRWIRKDGRIIHSVMAAQCVRRSDRSVDYFIGLVRDTTERRRAEDALSRLQSELMHVARVATLGELAASIAHDVNQPLTAIITNGHACMRWLGHEMPNIREATEAAERIVRDAKLAAGIITRIREFLKRGASQVGPTDLIGAISEVVAMVDAQIRSDGVLLQIGAAANLPLVAADRIQLQQVILNLVMNALDAMTAITGRARVLQIELLRHDARVVHIAVRDSGIGLTKEHRDRAFDAFHTTKPHGMGMGLAISRSIVEAHGGQLWATPNDNYGETFHFTIPIAAH